MVRVLWLILKYTLAVIGAYLLVALYIERFGLFTALWLLVFPLAWGFISYFSDPTSKRPAP